MEWFRKNIVWLYPALASISIIITTLLNVDPLSLMLIVIVICAIGIIYFSNIFNNENRRIENIKLLEAEKEKFKESIRNFRNFSKDIKNDYFSVLKEYHSNKDLYKLDRVLEIYKKGAEKAVNNIAQTFKSLTGEEVSSCVKLICTDNEFIDNYFLKYDTEKTSCITICRNEGRSSNLRRTRDKIISNTQNERNIGIDKYRLEYVREHSIFVYLINKYEESFIYFPDIKMANEADNSNSYSNPNKDFPKYYNTTISVPIRCHRDNLYYQIGEQRYGEMGNDHPYDVIGFLCVDAKSANVFDSFNNERGENTFADLMTAYASMLYIYFNRCRHLIKMSYDEALKRAQESESQSLLSPPKK